MLNFKQWMQRTMRSLQPEDPLRFMRRNTLTVNCLSALKQAMNWKNDPQLDAEHLHAFGTIEDMNNRRLRDAEVIYTACANGEPSTILEIGTAFGETTAQIARHAPHATVHTVNIPPEQIEAGGRNVTYAVSRDDIGRAYREAGCENVQQILANTATWRPDFGPIDIAFIDGCHDTEFVINDTLKVLDAAKPGSLILWHDFNPALVDQYDWIREVCVGIDQLYRKGRLSNRILHLRDSWVGLYEVTELDIAHKGFRKVA